MVQCVNVERWEHIVTVTLNQEAKLNAVSLEMWNGLDKVFAELDQDETLRCIILRGSGDRAFSVGADISEFEEHRNTVAKAKRYAQRTHAALQRIAACRHPVIARLDGLCVGGGLEIAANTDLRLASKRARFGIPIKRLGLVVAYAELEPLVRLVGPANAMEILMEGQIFGADRAYEMGLVNRIVPSDTLDEEVQATAERIAEGAPLVARWHKKFVRRLLSPKPLTEKEKEESYACFGTDDFDVGYRAFLAKEQPVFKGK